MVPDCRDSASVAGKRIRTRTSNDAISVRSFMAASFRWFVVRSSSRFLSLPLVYVRRHRQLRCRNVFVLSRITRTTPTRWPRADRARPPAGFAAPRDFRFLLGFDDGAAGWLVGADNRAGRLVKVDLGGSARTWRRRLAARRVSRAASPFGGTSRADMRGAAS